jgi:hypothetical protein
MSKKFVLAAAIGLAFLSTCAVASAQAPAKTPSALAAANEPFLGVWDLTLQAPDREYPSWLEVDQKGSNLTAQFVGRWGNARPLPKVAIDKMHITFVSPKEEEDSKADLVFEGTLLGKAIAGTVNGPDGKTWKWTAVRAPKLDRGRTPVWAKPITLFNGKDLTGWHPSKPGAPEWTVKDGALVTPGNGPELISDLKFQDFKLHIEFKCDKESNSGVYLRGRYELQVETDSVGEGPTHHTGAIYGFLAPTPEQPRTPDVWQTYDITLVGRRVTVLLNGKTVEDNKEIPGITGGALNSNEGQPGPIYLQGSEKGHVAFRNIVITPGT